MKETKVCTCDCHQDGVTVMHAFACCDLCYVKYIDVDGNIDINRLGLGFKRLYNITPTYKKYGEDIYWVHL